jgi:folate-dependent tRNA-U54 methylase TrmFO/GidA
MLLHCTKRLAEKIPHDHCRNAAIADLQVERMPLGEWHGHLFLLDRRQCVLFCHDLTRYVLFLPGLRAAQLVELGRWHRELFLATHAVQGLPSSHLVRLELLMHPLRIDC